MALRTSSLNLEPFSINEEGSFVTLQVDDQNKINVILHSTILKTVDDVNKGFVKEPRTLKLPYGLFLDKVLPTVISAVKYFKNGSTEPKVFLNSKTLSGVTSQVVQSITGKIALDIR